MNVSHNLSHRQSEFVESVLRLAPPLAVFDCDGTLWDTDSGQEFFYWELERNFIAEPTLSSIRRRYDDYLAGKVAEETMCGEMVTIHAGLQSDRLAAAAREFFDEKIVQRIFPEMLALTQALAQLGCELWAVSSTNNWVVEVGAARFGIPPERVLAACARVNSGTVTDELLDVPSGEGKARALRARLGERVIDAAFGNSIHDAAMLRLARHAFAIKPTAELENIARTQGWTIYQPGS